MVRRMSAVVPDVVTEINYEHRMARESAATAVQHAIRCGQLLVEQKARLKHGQFNDWLRSHCEFERSTATRYMLAARKIAQGVAISNLSGLFPSGRIPKPGSIEHVAQMLGVSTALMRKTARILREHPERFKELEDGSSTTDAVYSELYSKADEDEITAKDAIEILGADFNYHQMISRYRGHRNVVGKLRNKLEKAQVELAEAEKVLIQAALQKRGES